MLRINIFANGDTRRQNGRVILLDRQQQQQHSTATPATSTTAFHNFLVDCAKKLQFTQLDGLVAYTSQGGLVEDLSQLLQNDTLFIARSHEKFKFKYRVLLIGDSGDHDDGDEIEELSSSSSSHLLLSRHMVHHYLSDSQHDDHMPSDHSDDNHSDPMNAPPPPPPPPPTTTVVTTATTATPTEVVTTGDNQGDESDNDDDDENDDESPPAHQQQRNSSSSLKQREQQQQQLYTINIKYVRESLLLDQKSNGIDEYTFVTDCPERRSVKSVKKWLSRHRLNGCHINDITLIRNGQALSAEHRVIDLFDSGVNAAAATVVAADDDDDDKQQQVQQPTRSCTLFLIIKPMMLYIRQMRGGNATITMNENVSHETLVKDVKSLVLRRTGLSHVKLMFNQRELIDGQKLSAYEVMSGAVIYAC